MVVRSCFGTVIGFESLNRPLLPFNHVFEFRFFSASFFFKMKIKKFSLFLEKLTQNVYSEGQTRHFVIVAAKTVFGQVLVSCNVHTNSYCLVGH